LRSLANNLPLQKGDKVLYLSVVYPMVRNVVKYLSDYKGIIPVIANISFPLSNPQDVLVSLRDSIQKHPGIKIAALDHISSYPAALLPIKEMIKICQQNNIFVLVDGAHVLGQIPLDLTDLGADAYITNVHKWAYNPKSACILHVQKKWQPLIIPNIMSSEYAEHVGFVPHFNYIGTINYNAFLATSASLAFRKSLGDSEINQYNHNLAWRMGIKVAELWKTTLLVTNEAMVPALSLVTFPTNDPNIVGHIRDVLETKYNTWIQTGSVVTNDGINTQYVRLSAQIYLEESDFILMAERVLEIIKTYDPNQKKTVKAKNSHSNIG